MRQQSSPGDPEPEHHHAARDDHRACGRLRHGYLVGTAPSGHQKVTVTPATGLKSGQKVLVQASGFSPGESLVVTECAAKGAATGPGDCDLNGMQSVTADASGQVKVDLTVTKGPFGANNIVCGPAQACLISVTQATPSPTQEADTPITFGLPGYARRRRSAGP
jgi:hypothetical protein